jgi:hypothetical protein
MQKAGAFDNPGIPASLVMYGWNLMIFRNGGFLPGWKCGAETL